MKKRFVKTKLRESDRGFSIPELLIVLLIIAIIIVLALPQILSSRRLLRFAGVQRQIVSTLREARQEAMSQRTQVTFRYDNLNKTVVLFGGSFGAFGDPNNQVTSLADSGLSPDDLIYGKPSTALPAALGDGTNLTSPPLVADVKEVTFRGDGSAVDAGGNPVDSAFFFFDNKSIDSNGNHGSAFAVSVLGAGGRVKVWRYVVASGVYVE